MNGCIKLVQPSQSCLLCGAASLTGPVCPPCRASLPAAPRPACPYCGLESPHGAVCGSCLRHPPPWKEVRAALSYRHPADVLIRAYKYGGELALAPFLADRLFEHVANEPPPDWVVPLPLHPERLASRGFDQALELARPLARQLGLELATDVLVRVRPTQPQARLDAAARAKNVRGAFQCTPLPPSLAIALVDDVMTSGATVAAATQALRDAGAAEVRVWVLARALPPTPPA